MHTLFPQNRFRQIIRNIKNKRVLVFGDLILDKYIWGQVSRISQEAPVPVVAIKKESYRLGGGANVAHNLRKMGAIPLCMGIVGVDNTANQLCRLLKEIDVSPKWLIKDKSRPTTIKTRLIAQSQQIVRMDREITQDISSALQDKVIQQVKRAIKEVDAIILSDYAKGMVTQHLIEAVVEMARAKELFIAVDPKEKHFQSYKGVSLITPNIKEAEAGSGLKIKDDESIKTAGWKLKDELELGACLITLSEKGMALFEDKRQFTHIPTVASEVYDVTGAGDTVISVFTAAKAGKATNKEAAIISNYAAGIVVRETGTATTTPQTIEAAMYGN